MTLKNIDKSYTIEVINNQTIDGETAAIAEKAIGSFSRRNNKVYIRYKTADGGDVISTVIIADKDAVTVKRSGSVSSVMIFKRNSKTNFMYSMPYGSVAMQIDTKLLAAAFGENGGTLKIRYTLTSAGEKYENNMVIRVTEGDIDED